MKCPQCGHMQQRKQGFVCSKCGYNYHFDPKGADNPLKLSDGQFKALIRHATANGTRFVTEDELYAVACRRLLAPSGSLSGLLYGLGWVAVLCWMVLSSYGALLIGFALLALGFSVSWLPRHLSRGDWDQAVYQWRMSGREIDNLITEPSLDQPPPEWTEPDIYDYGFERLLICDDRLTVDWLVKNGMHTQERALILSERGYPSYLVPLAQRALEAQPNLPVFLLHAYESEETSPMEVRVKHQRWWPKGCAHSMIDMGLNDEDVKKLGLPKEVGAQASIAAHALPMGVFLGLMPLAFSDGLTLAAASQRKPVESYG